MRRYQWSAKLSLSILTDFEEFAVYSSRQRPKVTDKASTERVLFFTYRDYINHWDELKNLFSKQAVLKGSFDKYAESTKKKRGTQEVDDEFLDEIEKWREKIARNIALRNPNISVHELNISVQRTIDRIIFLRICEDRGIEKYGRLRNIAQNENIYENLTEVFKEADDKYNSGLFHFKKERGRVTYPDELTLNIEIDDQLLRSIFRRLYYPNSPYEFSVISTEILGNIYEQFLGKIIRLTKGHRAKVEEKPEVKKAGGVYYTPKYIVDYIVDNTVGKLCDGKTPNKVSKLRILDPACGSGSFLIGAYSYLLKWHLDYYTNLKDKKRYKDRVYQEKNGEWFLTIQEKKRILLNNIYGVDIDNQAVEVTKLSLLLKVLEGEKRDRFEKQQKLWQERALPDLGYNIKCGNSLISPGFFKDGIQNSIDGENLFYDINPFNWEKEFEEIMAKGGFDAVIGNPPYRMLQPHNTTDEILDYLKKHYFAANFKIDFFHLFIQKGLSLVKEKGSALGYIIPVTILNNVYVKQLRNWITDTCKIERIAVANEKVFAADVHTGVVIFEKEKKSNMRNNNEILTTRNLNFETYTNNTIDYTKIKQVELKKLSGSVWNILINNENSKMLFRLIDECVKLKDISEINRGLITGNKDKYFSDTKLTESHIPIIAGKDVFRYYTNEPKEFVLFERPKTAGGCWQKEVHLAPHKIVIRQIGKEPTASLLDYPLAVTGNIFTIRCNSLEMEKYVLGIINSKLIKYFWKIMFTDFKSSFPQVTIFSLSQIPIKIIDEKDQKQKLKDVLIKKVDEMLELKNKIHMCKVSSDKNILQRQINHLDEKINDIVNDLCDLTDDEIKIIN